MTLDEVMELTGRTFEFTVSNADGSIAFCVPIPGSHLPYGTDDDGNLIIPGPMDVWQEAWDNYIAKFQPPKRQYRTKDKAGDVVTLPEPKDGIYIMPIITNPDYRYATSFLPSGNAHLTYLQNGVAEKLEFRDGQLYLDGVDASRVDLVKLSTNEGIADIDLQTLRVLYAILLHNIGPHIREMIENDIQGYEVKLYLPDLFEMIGIPKSDINEKSIDNMITKIKSYHNLLGIMRDPANPNRTPSQYIVLDYHGYDAATKVVRLAAPYMGMVIKLIFEASIRTDKKKTPMLKKNGQFLMKPAYSYLIKAELAKARNKRAAEIVVIVVALIEQAGNNVPHIDASTIIARDPGLQQALEGGTTAQKNMVLKRAFSGAWKYLRKYTLLQKHYANIQLPEPTDVPTVTRLSTTYRFPHDGKCRN